MISDSDINKIIKIIQDHFDILNHIVTGAPSSDAELLESLGIDKNALWLIALSYQLGWLNINNPNLTNLSIPQIKTKLQSIKLTPTQTSAINQLCKKTQQTIKSLSQRTVNSVVNNVVSLNFQTVIKPTTNAKEFSRSKLIQQLRDSTGDMKRDWHRVVNTEVWDAKLQGETNAILSGNSPFSSDKEETMVYKRPAPDCCPVCKKLYLEKDGVTPKVFKLADLLSNGTNFGRKQGDWVATLGTVHPNCQCTLNVKPKDTKFDKDGNLVFNPTRGGTDD